MGGDSPASSFGGRKALPQGDKRDHLLAVNRARHADHAGFEHAGVMIQGLFHFLR